MTAKSFLSTAERIDALACLGDKLKTITANDEAVFQHAYHKNNWFTRENVLLAVRNIANEFLNKQKLTAFAERYDLFQRVTKAKTVALVFAGNVPLVGFHDWLCVMLAGHTAQVKLSSKDDVLFPHFLESLRAIEPRFAERTRIVERLHDFDAVIATGSNNSARYFDYYFGKYPHVIRRNRSSVAVIDDTVTPQQLEALADDVFAYFGLGCRNVSKLFIHQGMDVNDVLQRFGKYAGVMDHHKYKNNFDYRLTLLLMNNTPYRSNNFLLAVENEALCSPLGMVHYEHYADANALNDQLASRKDDIQIVIGNGHQPFGSSQSPSLPDYADGVDTMEFLLKPA